MEELIFFAVIIIFSILESIARSRKAKQGGEVEDEGSQPDPEGWAARLPDLEAPAPDASDDDLPTYDEDPSYDEVARQEGEVREREQREAARRREEALEGYRAPEGSERRAERPSPSEVPEPRRPSSETMLPGDLLEQLESLARGRKTRRQEPPTSEAPERSRRPRTIEAPTPSTPPPTPIEQREVGSGRRPSAPVGSTAPVGSRTPIGTTPIEHEIHGAHAGYGTDPSSRARSEQDGLDPLAERLDADGVEVRRLLLGGGRPALRAAMVLKEVLGPPLTMRDEGGHPASATSPPAPSS